MNEWEAPSSDVVVMTRVRLARNFADVPFESVMSDEEAAHNITRVAEGIEAAGRKGDFTLARLADMTESVEMTATSPRVLGMHIGLPVVPLEQWKRTISSIGAPRSPIGYSSRRSTFLEKGSSLMSASVFMCSGLTPRSSQRLRKSGTRSYAYSTVHLRRCS